MIRSAIKTLAAAAIVGLALHAGPVAAQSFLEGFEDVPVMPGLTGVDGAGVAFDTAAGRIVEAYATGAVSSEKVVTFYTDTLASLGWQRASERHFVREGESLTLDFFGGDGNLTVRFTLAPE